MMPPRSLSSGSAFNRPLRDVLRGVGFAWEATEEILDPVASLVPSSLRDGFKATVEGIDRVADQVNQPPPPSDVPRAAAFLNGSDVSDEGADAFVRVWVYAADQASAAMEQGHFMVSETLAGAALARTGQGLTDHARAAEILLSLRRLHSVASIPRTLITLSPDASRNVDLALFATALWLLSERESELEIDLRLFRLVLALTRTLQDRILAAFEDAGKLASELAELEQHI